MHRMDFLMRHISPFHLGATVFRAAFSNRVISVVCLQTAVQTIKRFEGQSFSHISSLSRSLHRPFMWKSDTLAPVKCSPFGQLK